MAANLHGPCSQKRWYMEKGSQPDIGKTGDHTFQELVESLAHVVFVLDDKGHFTYLSPQCEGILGLPPEGIIGRPISSVVIPQDRDRLCSKYREVKTGASYPSDYIVVDKDGKHHVVRAVSRPFVRGDGKTGVVGIISGITNWLTAEEVVQASEETVRQILSYSRDGIVLADETGTLIEWSPAMEQISGIRRAEALGRPFWDLQYASLPQEKKTPESREELQARYHALLGNEATALPGEPGIEYTIERPDRSRRDIEACRFLIPTDKGGMGASIVRDISERKKNEDALRQANRQLTLMTSLTRHDINNKLAIILGYLAIAIKKEGDPVLRDHLGKIEEATKAIQTQIAFTRVYQDIGSTAPRWHDLDAVISRLAVPQNVALKSDVSGCEIFADAMLERAFFNLLDNSVRHGEHVTTITVRSEKTADGLVLSWEDNGIGIPPAEKDKIFNRGFGKNTGLGLFLVREILNLTGITIRETGEPGKGARFDILVPEGKYRTKKT